MLIKCFTADDFELRNMSEVKTTVEVNLAKEAGENDSPFPSV